MIDPMKGPVKYGQLRIALSIISGRITELDPADYEFLTGRELVNQDKDIPVSDGLREWSEELVFHAIFRGIDLH